MYLVGWVWVFHLCDEERVVDEGVGPASDSVQVVRLGRAQVCGSDGARCELLFFPDFQHGEWLTGIGEPGTATRGET
jgi:hypothetical protein